MFDVVTGHEKYVKLVIKLDMNTVLIPFENINYADMAPYLADVAWGPHLYRRNMITSMQYVSMSIGSCLSRADHYSKEASMPTVTALTLSMID